MNDVVVYTHVVCVCVRTHWLNLGRNIHLFSFITYFLFLFRLSFSISDSIPILLIQFVFFSASFFPIFSSSSIFVVSVTCCILNMSYDRMRSAFKCAHCTQILVSITANYRLCITICHDFYRPFFSLSLSLDFFCLQFRCGKAETRFDRWTRRIFRCNDLFQWHCWFYNNLCIL